MKNRCRIVWIAGAVLLVACKTTIRGGGDEAAGLVDVDAASKRPVDAGLPTPDANLAATPDAQIGCENGTPTGTCAPAPCQSVTCVDGGCVYEPLADGTSCGENLSSRCCGAACVDTSTDAENCGGCGLACGAGLSCESVAATACVPNPELTSGRCVGCTANSQCPVGAQGQGQVCRTETPYANHCSPNSDDACAAGQSFVESFECPNFCTYPP